MPERFMDEHPSQHLITSRPGKPHPPLAGHGADPPPLGCKRGFLFFAKDIFEAGMVGDGFRGLTARYPHPGRRPPPPLAPEGRSSWTMCSLRIGIGQQSIGVCINGYGIDDLIAVRTHDLIVSFCQGFLFAMDTSRKSRCMGAG